MIYAAGCFLPKPQKEELINKELGSRHRAAIGMSEVSDAIVIIVSEETGIISIDENGVLERGFDREKALGLGLSCGGMEFATEIIDKFALSGAKIAEIPVTLSPDGRSGGSHLRTLRDGMRHILYIFFGSRK